MGKFNFFNIFKKKEEKKLLDKGLDINVATGFLDKLEDIVCIADDKYKIDYINVPSLANKYNYLLDLLYYDENKELFNEIIESTQQNGFYINDVKLVKDKKTVDMYIAMYHVETVNKYIVYMKDTNKYKKNENMLKEELSRYGDELRNRDLFVANLSHEIRTPINVIIAMVYFLKSTKLDETQNEYLRKLGESADLLAELVNNMLNVTKSQKVTNSINTKETFNLRTFLDKIQEMFEEEAREKGLGWSIETNFDTNIQLHEDKVQLEQLIINLINNALKYTDKGYVELSVNKLKENLDSYNIRFCVKDTGRGIKKEDSIKIFKEFEQINDPTIKEREGFGLGLPLVRKIVESMGGKIWLESSYGLGSKFYIELQLMKDIDYKNISEIAPIDTEIEIPNSENKRVLLVDDNNTINEITSKVLKEIGVDCDIVQSGTEAIRIVEEKGTSYYSLILMDIHMPKYNGYDISRILKEDIGLKTPIVALTATNITEKIIEENKEYISSYIQKPIRPEELQNTVKRILEQKTINANTKKEKLTILLLADKNKNKELISNLEISFKVICTLSMKDIAIITETKKIDALVINKMDTTINDEELNQICNVRCTIIKLNYEMNEQNEQDIIISTEDGSIRKTNDIQKARLILLEILNQRKKEEMMDNTIGGYNDEISNIYSFLYDSLLNLTSVRSKETGSHLMRTKEYMKTMLMEYEKSFPTSQFVDRKVIENIGVAATLHDIGKVGIPDNILNKPGKLTEEEYEKMKEHTTIGHEILSTNIGDKLSNDILEYAKEITLHHHEKYDGTGYPDKLKGDEINIISEIMSVIDVYDALSNKRVYKDAQSYEETENYIISQSGIAFDPKVVNVFMKVKDKFRAINEKYKEEDKN